MFKQVKTYGFLNRSQLEKGKFQEESLDIDGIPWVKTGEFSDLAHNHCGAVLMTNLLLYFSKIGARNLLKANPRQTFIEIHKRIGNGPVLRLTSRSRPYFAKRGYRLRNRTVKDFLQVQKSISEGRPLGLLLRRSNFDWHWVLIVGWRQYQNGLQYYRIIDGWNKRSDRYYQPNKASKAIKIKEYWLEKA